MKLDLHVHTTHSRDGYTDPQLIPYLARRKKMDGLAMTEHDKLVKLSFAGLVVIPGMEISTSGGHIIALGIDVPVRARLSPEETIELIRDQGGVAIIPHPYDPFCECVNLKALKARPDAVETINADAAFFRLSKRLAERDAKRLGLPAVAGSDSHIPETIGDAYTLVEADSTRIEDILAAVRKGHVKPQGHPTSHINKFRKLARRLTG